MTRALSIALAVLAGFVPPARAELLREVFPVPPVVDAAFRSGGLAAFDPFDAWQGGNVRPAVLLTPSDPGGDAALLPLGACYDLLPAWTARGFKPHDGTRVLYHPQTQLIFARIAPEDDAQVRAFCEWPPAMWMSDTYWGEGGVHQVLYRITSYSVPATGPGGWDFQPSTVEELLALPAEARRILQRQSMVIRGGQRAKVEGYATRQQDRVPNLTGLIVEAECTVGEDGSWVDLNNAPQLAARLDDGTHAVLSSQFQQLIEWGNSWLMEAGTLPGNPPRRIFQTFETLRVHAELWDSKAFTRCCERWTGRATDTSTLRDGVTGRALYLMDFPPRPRSSAEEKDPPAADPFAAPEPAERKPPDPPESIVPELFGDVPMQDMSAALTAAAGAPTGQLQAWRRNDHSRYYVRGTPDGMAALTRWLEKAGPYGNVGTAVAEATVRLLPQGDAGERKTIWRSTIPVRSGQRSALKLFIGDSTEEGKEIPFACLLEIEGVREGVPSPDPFDADTFAWSLTAKVSLRPPVVDSPVSMEEASETGTRNGVVLCRAVGRTAAGETIVLTIHLREKEVRSPWWSVPPLHDWWWQRQLSKAAAGVHH